MDAQEIVVGIGNLLRLRICLLLKNRELVLNQIKEEYEKIYKVKINRETVYRCLEILVKNEIVDKKYNKKSKKILYSMIVLKTTIDFDSGKIIIERK